MCSAPSTKTRCSVSCSSQCALSLEQHSAPLQKSKSKSKVYPSAGHEGPEVEYIYRCTLSLTSYLDWGGWSTPSSATLLPRRTLFALYRILGVPPAPFFVQKFGKNCT